VGDVVPVELAPFAKDGSAYPSGVYHLRQIPEIDGAVVALDPHTGRILAMSGGFSYERSQFNRVIQARRQPGSAFKPFVYLAALDRGFTPSTLILDAPFVIDQGPGRPKWRPANYTKKFYGPSTMRLGIEKSRNLMTVRLAQTIGIETIVDYAQKFGISDKLPNQLSMSLGAGETTLLKLTTAYAMLVNGGKLIEPTLIDRIQDRHGKTVFVHDPRSCAKCRPGVWEQQLVPIIPDHREQLVNPASAYQMVSMLEGVVQRGTGRSMLTLGKPLAGKTGTTNKAFDTWFIGFSPDLAVGVFVGFDAPRSLGKREQGASVSAPIFKEFMKNALSNKPSIPFRIPPGIRLVRVDAETGRLARPGDRRIILEAFKPGTVPKGETRVLDGYENMPKSAPTVGIGGLY
jgi:penicillin-binding protein 1A